MFARRFFTIAILFTSVAFAQSISPDETMPDTAFPSLSGTSATPNTPTPTTPRVAAESSYSQINADVLKKTLFPKSPRESAYLDGVIALRDKGKITNQSLNSAYNYAMKKRQDRRVQYFQNALETITRRY